MRSIDDVFFTIEMEEDGERWICDLYDHAAEEALVVYGNSPVDALEQALAILDEDEQDED